MFFLRKKTKEQCVFAPAKGKIKPLSQVDDPVFAAGTMGMGFAIDPDTGAVCAPVGGQISTIFPGGHALGITTPDGAEVLVHIGIDTVKRKGDGFTVHAKAGDTVRPGETLVEADIKKLKTAGFKCDVIVVVTSPGKCRVDESMYNLESQPGKTCVMKYTVSG